MREHLLDRLRSLCLALPEANESGGVGDPSFKVQDKIFAMQHLVKERMSLWCKAPSGAQNILINAAPERFFIPPYVGRHGWIGLWLDAVTDWDEVADLVEESYRMTAPKRLCAQLDQLNAAINDQPEAL